MRLVIAIFVALMRWASGTSKAAAAVSKSARGQLGDRFVAYLRSQGLAVEVVAQSEESLTIRLDGLERKMSLENMEGAVAEHGEEAVFAKNVAIQREAGRPGDPIDPARLRPRLLRAVDYQGVPMLRTAYGATGLDLVYVVDTEHAMRFLTPDDLRALGWSGAQLDRRARENLANTFDVTEMVRDSLATGQPAFLNEGDGYDAARLLLLQEALAPGQAIGVLARTRDLLIVTPPPPRGNWDVLTSMGKEAPGPPLLERPLRMTRTTIDML